MLYFVENKRRKAVKIGFSDDPARRLFSLQTSSPDRLTLLGVCPGTRDDEKELHTRFIHLCIRGEWFRPDAELLETIRVRCNGHQLWGRCRRCGNPNVPLRESPISSDFVCQECAPDGFPRTLRRSRESERPTMRIPAGGGYRIVRHCPRQDRDA